MDLINTVEIKFYTIPFQRESVTVCLREQMKRIMQLFQTEGKIKDDKAFCANSVISSIL